jgi:hypothetical protein
MLLLFKELDKVYFHPASNLDYSMSQLSDWGRRWPTVPTHCLNAQRMR